MPSLTEWHPAALALVATLGTWAVTALGAGLVIVFRDVEERVLDAMLGFASGVMIAASVWSLLIPAMELTGGRTPWLPATVGLFSGACFLGLIDQLLPHLHPGQPEEHAEGLSTEWQRTVLLVLAITLHNIPEGLAVGVAFGAAALGMDSVTLGAAVALAIGIGIQNLPEGAAVSVPLRREGMSRRKSFWYGQMSGAVEPVAGVIGALAVLTVRPILPYALSFAAGAMLFVVVEELIPESQTRKSKWATMSAVAGFAVMMILDVALG